MSKLWAGQNYSGSKCHILTSHSLFSEIRVEEQSVHFGSKCSRAKTLQGQIFTVLKHYRVKVHCDKTLHDQSVSSKTLQG
jgi:hypothetical protein